MKVVGIVAEYNPFHKGHAYQISKIREIFGENTAVVCVMSGDFVQRGEPAVFSKFARSEAAIRCGADLVIELPVCYSVSSAERFADGAVSVLGRLGIVDHIVFGSERGEVEPLIRTAKALLDPSFDTLVRLYLQQGCSYPAARSMALSEMLGGNDVTDLPNDNLGVEYIKAILRKGYPMIPYAIRREGAMHDRDYDGEMKSGSELRRMIQAGEDISDFVPPQALEVYKRETALERGPVSPEALELQILSRLRMLSSATFELLPDAAEGLENKLYKACRKESSLMNIYNSVKSKRYTHARIRRMTMCAALGITADDYAQDNLYARVLALNPRGAAVLRMTEECRSIPVYSKPSLARSAEEAVAAMFEKSADAHDLYVLGYSNPAEMLGGLDWSASPVFVKDGL